MLTAVASVRVTAAETDEAELLLSAILLSRDMGIAVVL